MSTYAKMRAKRDNWRRKTAQAKAELRYQRKEKRRIKKERDHYREASRKANKELDERKRQKATLPVRDKTSLVFLALQLFVVARIGFRAVSRVLAVFAPRLGLAKTPCPQTTINWVTRLSIARMTGYRSPGHSGAPLPSSGFILLLDASIGLGKGKILTVLALDARHHLLNQGAPSLQQVICLAVAVNDTWTGESIAKLLREVIARIGKPLAYLKDGGTDLGKAVRLLSEQGSTSVSIDDISHFVANLLKHEFQNHALFDVFLRACGAVSRLFKQTILACVAPPKVSIKARFMNLHRLVKWAALLLAQSPRGRATKGSLLQKLRDRLDQLPQCRRFINDFLLNAEPLIECQKILKTQGLSQKSGVFAPNSRYRGRVTKAKRGRGGRCASTGDPEALTLTERRASMTWAQRLRRVFNIDIETCPACGGAVRIIACIEDAEVIEKILTHLDEKGGSAEAFRRPPCRAPPPAGLFD